MRHKFTETADALQRYEMLARHTRDIILFLRRKDGRILDANAAAIKAYGYTLQELQALTIHDIRVAGFCDMERQMAQAERGGVLFETIHRRKDGTAFPVEVESWGETIAGVRTVISVIRDSTERKRAEAALRKAHDELEQRVRERTRDMANTNRLLQLYALQSSKKEYLDAVVRLLQEWTGYEAVGLRVLSREGDIPYESQVGFSREFWESESALSIHRDRCICTRVVAGVPEPHDMPYMMPKGSFHCGDMPELFATLSTDGKERFRAGCMAEGYASVTVVPVSYRGKTLGAIHLADRAKAKVPEKAIEFIESVQPLIGEAMHRFDLEEERERLQHQLVQAQKMEALGTATGGIAHDFNNILAAIIGFTEIARGRVAKGSREESHLGRVLDAAMRGRELIRQMLVFSRKAEYQKRPVRLSALVDETINLLRASIPTTIDIRVNVRSESGVVTGDENQIQQVLMNLCTNAAHAMGKKGGVLEIELSDYSVSANANGNPQDMKPGLYMKMSVRDTGEGIAPEHMSRIFDPFFTTKALGQGTGLGLSVVHGIVKQHDGYVSLESRTGAGSVFDVYLPKAQGERRGDAHPEERAPGGTERVLFVDDEEALVEMGREILEELGYDVTATNSSLEAIALFRADPDGYDLIVTDQTMPDMTGIDLAREALSVRRDIPIVLCTGFSQRADSESARTAGVKAFAGKPLTKAEIGRIIREALGG